MCNIFSFSWFSFPRLQMFYECPFLQSVLEYVFLQIIICLWCFRGSQNLGYTQELRILSLYYSVVFQYFYHSFIYPCIQLHKPHHFIQYYDVFWMLFCCSCFFDGIGAQVSLFSTDCELTYIFSWFNKSNLRHYYKLSSNITQNFSNISFFLTTHPLLY